MAHKMVGHTTVYASISLIILVALLGAVLIFQGYADSAELALIELIILVVGVAALLLAVLGSVNSAYQMRMVQKIAKEMQDAIKELKDIDQTNESIRRKLNQDYALAKEIAHALAEAGVIEDDHQRRVVAGDVEQRVRRRVSGQR